MMCRSFTSQKGFSPIKILIAIVILGLLGLYLLPTPIGGGPFEIVNRLSNKVKAVVNGLTSKAANAGAGVADRWDSIKAGISGKIRDWLDRWNLKKLSQLISGVASYKLAGESFELLMDENIPEEILDDLRALENQEFTKKREFLSAIKEQIGEVDTEKYQDLILEYAAVTVEDKWREDMDKLVGFSKSRGFSVPRTERRRAEYENRKVSWRRVENEFWDEIREQTQTAITQGINRFRARPLGCSDFTVEMRDIWEIGESFNEDTWDGFARAKELSEQLQQPRSERFITELMDWLVVANVYPARAGNWSGDPFIRQLNRAITQTSEGQIPDYPQVIKELDSQPNSSQYSVGHILRDIVVAEIYLNYDLINPAEDRFDEAIRNLSAMVGRYQQHNPYTMTSLGLHMALGLLHERICKNADLAIKEFKEVVAIATRLGLPCEKYSIAHFHLGVINMNLRIGPEARPVFEETTSSHSGTTEELVKATPTPWPTVTPVPTATPKPILKLTKKETTETEYVLTRKIQPGGRDERPVGEEQPVVEAEATPTAPAEGIPPAPVSIVPTTTGVIKGTLQPGEKRRAERDIRLRPRTELGETRKMKKFNVNDLYDLSKIPDDAARELELYLKCMNRGDRAIIARFVNDKYMGK